MSLVRHELGSRGYIPFENVVLCSGETMPYLYRAVLLVWTPNDSEDCERNVSLDVNLVSKER